MQRNHRRSLTHAAVFAVVAVAALVTREARMTGETPANDESAQITFTKDIAPILQSRCESCHRPRGGAPMSLITYEEVRPWAKAIKNRTGLGSSPDVMPPWFIDKTLGIQRYKDDMSLSADQVAKIAKWSDAGAPRGNPADMPPPLKFTAENEWALGKPDLILSSPSFEMAPTAPDWYGPLGSVSTGLTEDRYVASVEAKEVTESVEAAEGARQTVGGQVIFHHLVYAAVGPKGETDNSPWPIYNVARNGDLLDPQAGLPLRAGGKVVFTSTHMHANGRRTKAHIDFGFRFHPKGYKPTLKLSSLRAFTRNLDIKPMEANQRFEGFLVLQQNAKIMVFEPHMHAAGVRMCLDAIWGTTAETLTCAGYNHSWVRNYTYADDAQPLLPKGTILRATSYYDNTPANKNIADPRNWVGLGDRSMDNMSIGIVTTIYLSDEEFKRELAKRRVQAKKGHVIGCPQCGFDEDSYAAVAHQRRAAVPIE